MHGTKKEWNGENHLFLSQKHFLLPSLSKTSGSQNRLHENCSALKATNGNNICKRLQEYCEVCVSLPPPPCTAKFPARPTDLLPFNWIVVAKSVGSCWRYQASLIQLHLQTNRAPPPPLFISIPTPFLLEQQVKLRIASPGV